MNEGVWRLITLRFRFALEQGYRRAATRITRRPAEQIFRGKVPSSGKRRRLSASRRRPICAKHSPAPTNNRIRKGLRRFAVRCHMEWLWAILLLVTLVACWSLNFIGLPGNWINVLLAALYAWLMPLGQRADIGWVALAIMLLLATIGEIFEFAAGAAGASTVGGSKRGAGLALAGALTGGIVGIFIGLPIPFIGPIISPILFSAVGALIGSMLGEQWKGRDLKDSFWIGHAAFWGRLAGTIGKIAVGAAMIVVALVAMVV